jgi:hypothetical protein
MSVGPDANASLLEAIELAFSDHLDSSLTSKLRGVASALCEHVSKELPEVETRAFAFGKEILAGNGEEGAREAWLRTLFQRVETLRQAGKGRTHEDALCRLVLCVLVTVDNSPFELASFIVELAERLQIDPEVVAASFRREFPNIV